MKKKILAGAAAVCAAACMAVTAFAASSTTFYVNNVKVTGSHSYSDMWDYNPFAGDSVTATANAGAALDRITVKATIRFADGNTTKEYTSEPVTVKNGTSCEAKVTAKGLTISYGGGGWYEGYHNGNRNESTSSTNW